ncbi:hypothetical protein, partial [Pseudomonas orientalis]|uniref:hypothetical protein n=1 Tax=Pseudomonas orientalis TaxID=76758 RepID=UPI001A911FB2
SAKASYHGSKSCNFLNLRETALQGGFFVSSVRLRWINKDRQFRITKTVLTYPISRPLQPFHGPHHFHYLKPFLA